MDEERRPSRRKTTGVCQAAPRSCCGPYNRPAGKRGRMDRLIRRIDLTQARREEAWRVLRQEWLVTNGVGGYASGTIAGFVTWRYHGLLVAGLPAPFGRMVMLNHLTEAIRLPNGHLLQIGGDDPNRSEDLGPISHFITEFRLENGLPIWRYEAEEVSLEKYILFLHGQNTVHVHYRLLSKQEQLRLELRPSIHFRGHEREVNEGAHAGYRLSMHEGHYEVELENVLPRLRMVLDGDTPAFTYEGGSRREIHYQKEAER